jgi:hypothetical protein
MTSSSPRALFTMNPLAETLRQAKIPKELR